MPNSQENPYEAPQAVVRRRPSSRRMERLAGRGTRLAAVMLDGVFFWIAMFPAMMSMPDDPEMTEFGWAGFALAGVLMLALIVYNLILLSQNGWTLGKKLLSIRIVRTDGSEAGLGRILGLRIIVNALAGMLPLYGLIDPLFIFREDRRCVHDLIADTKVIQA